MKDHWVTDYTSQLVQNKGNARAGAKDWGSGSGDGSKENKMAPDEVRKAGLRFVVVGVMFQLPLAELTSK